MDDRVAFPKEMLCKNDNVDGKQKKERVIGHLGAVDANTT